LASHCCPGFTSFAKSTQNRSTGVPFIVPEYGPTYTPNICGPLAPTNVIWTEEANSVVERQRAIAQMARMRIGNRRAGAGSVPVMGSRGKF
jgi:hypothetical protein